MKAVLFVLLATIASAAGPTWVPKGSPVPDGLIRVGPLPMTGSMRPVLRGGEMLQVELYVPGKTKIEVGDFIGVNTKSGPRTHKITAMRKDAVMTSGIAERNSDGWSYKTSIIYVVRFVERP